MKDGDITKARSTRRRPLSGKTDWRRVDAMSDADAMRAAMSDPDARPTPKRDLQRFRRPVQVRELRRRLGMTQERFARTFGFSLGSVRDWEQMRSRPDAGTRALLQVIDYDPETVRRALDRRQKAG